MKRSPQLLCACGNPTDMICFFGDGNAHGVCEKCGVVRLIELQTGQIVSRWVCDACWKKGRSRAAIIP